MSNNLRAATVISNNAALAHTGTTTTSAAYVGTALNICIYLNSDTSASVALQVFVVTGAQQAGLNADTSGTWYTLNGQSSIALTAATPIAINISPFAPQYIRVKNVDGANDIAHLTAIVESNG